VHSLTNMLIDSWKNNDRVVSERLIADLKAVGERTRTNLRLHLGRTINRLWSKESAEAFRNPVLSALVELLTRHILNAGRPRKPNDFPIWLATGDGMIIPTPVKMHTPVNKKAFGLCLI
jgi:hypothetical protein